MHAGYQRFLFCLYYSLYFLSYVIVFSSVYIPFCFLRIWSVVLNGWNSYLLCFDYCFRYFMKFSAKFNMEFILWCSILMDCSYFFLFHLNSMNDYNWVVILPLMKSHAWDFVIFLCILTPFPNDHVYRFNHLWCLSVDFYIWPC